MKKTIYYATSNPGKFEEVRNFIENNEPTITLKQFSADIPEEQSLDQRAIAIQKARDAYALLGKPVLVDDSAIYLTAYKHFPGTMTKFVHKGLGFDGIFKLIVDDARAYFLLYLVYFDGTNEPVVFEGRCDGTIIKPASLDAPPTLPWDAVFLPTGAKHTYSQMRSTPDEEHYFYRIRAMKKFLSWMHNA